MKSELTKLASQYFEEAFGEAPQFICLSPGRINIIGEHIDYNDGFVLPAAIDKYVCMAISVSSDSNCVIVANDINEKHEFSLNDELEPVGKMWANYFLGVLSQLKARNFPLMKGFKLAFTSTIPIGSGLSSSAAVECGFCFALNEIFEFKLSKQEIALIGQKAEHTFVGVMCGIMDQFASVFGKEGKVIRLDCNTLEYEYHAADLQDYSLLLLDSNVKHELLTSNYNVRRQEVHSGLDIIKNKFPKIRTFRDCSEEHVIAVREELGETVFKRCMFVVSEIARVHEAVDAMDKHDVRKLGELLYETHDGLSHEYEVSCDETDFLVNTVRKESTVMGARMMGGGFGGCTINVVAKGTEDKLIERVTSAYKSEFGIDLKSYKVNISDGTTFYTP